MTKKCNQEGCNTPTDWVNRDTPRYSKGGYFRARCTSCSNLLSSYGINTPERDALIMEQNYKCLICECDITFKGSSNQAGMANNAAVDHCHVSGMVRGVLCMQCNLDLGKFETLQPKFNLFSKYIKEYGEQV